MNEKSNWEEYSNYWFKWLNFNNCSIYVLVGNYKRDSCTWLFYMNYKIFIVPSYYWFWLFQMIISFAIGLDIWVILGVLEMNEKSNWEEYSNC